MSRQSNDVRSGSRKLVMALALITAICLTGDSMLYIALPIHWKEAGISSLWEVGILLAINRLVRLPLGPVIGWMYHKISKRTGLIVAVALAVFTTTSYGLFSGFLAWIVLRCLWGLAWTILRMGAYLTIIELSDEHNRGSYFGTYNGLFRMGSLVGMLVGGFVADWIGIRPVAVGLGLLSLCAFPLVFKFATASKAETETANPFSFFTKIRGQSRVMWLLLTGLLSAMVCDGMFTSTLSHSVVAHYSRYVAVLGVVVGAGSLSGFLQALRWSWGPWLSPWFGGKLDRMANRERLLALIFTTVAIPLVLITFDLPLAVFIALVILILLLCTMLTTLMDSAVSAAAAGSLKIAVITSYTLAQDMGAALGPMLGYAVAIDSAYYIAAAILLLIAAKWWLTALAVRPLHS